MFLDVLVLSMRMILDVLVLLIRAGASAYGLDTAHTNIALGKHEPFVVACSIVVSVHLCLVRKDAMHRCNMALMWVGQSKGLMG